ncbi:MAG: hypothetical protein ABSH48_01770 [Verrucomicrobiota bacterium]
MINDPAIAEFGVVWLLSKHLRHFGRKFSLELTNDPAVDEAGTEHLIMNGLQFLNCRNVGFDQRPANVE